jgi:hypothetical protein
MSSDRYKIDVERPLRQRRGDRNLIVVVTDTQTDTTVYWQEDKFNNKMIRAREAEDIAAKTGYSPDSIADRIMQGIGKLNQPPPPPSSTTPDPGGHPKDYPYEATQGGFIWNKETAEGIIKVPLTTFTAEITGQVVEDDGAEPKRVLEIDAVLRGRHYSFKVPAVHFGAMSWPMEHMGAGAALWAGLSIKDHARAAIQFLSGDPPERKVYTHLGWREIDGSWLYLHAGGAIGPVGPVEGIEVSLAQELQRYLLPDPPTGKDLVDAISASLRLLDVAGDQTSMPVHCGIWRAAMGECDSSTHLTGPTGGGKTSIAALAQQHYGPELDARHVPGSWMGTDNSLETLAFVAKDALLLVDDFCPTGSQYDVQTMHRKADRLFRGQGNSAGRSRLRADGTLRPTRPPRGMVLSTGEDVPRGQSLRARILVQEVPLQGPGSVDFSKLTDCQAEASEGRYAQAMAGFVRWIAPQFGVIREHLKEEISELRTHAHQSGQHRRTPDIVANLAVGFRYFLGFAQWAGAVDAPLADELWDRCWAALGEVAAAQQGYQEASDPVQQFLALLMSVISSGRGHLADTNGRAPASAPAWGWREVQLSSGDFARTEAQPQGERIGWLDGDDVYLDSRTAFAVVQRMGGDNRDALSVSLPTLKTALEGTRIAGIHLDPAIRRA